MKLLQKTTKNYLVFSLIIFVISIPIFYFLVQNLWSTDVDESLLYQKEKIVKGLKNNSYKEKDILLFSKIAKDLDISVEIIPINGEYTAKDDIYKSNFYDDTRHHIEPYRELNSVVNINGIGYKINVKKDLVENQDLIQAIVAVQIILFLVFLLGIILLSNYLAKKIWNPFYFLISKLKIFKIDNEKPIEILNTDITEFNELNQSVRKLTEKNIEIYKAQKEFTENASHEIQTPIAVIKSKLDLLAQDPMLTKSQANIISKIDNNINLITKLNRNLLLLAKIENRQFPKKDTIFIDEILNETKASFDELLTIKQIQYTSEISKGEFILSNSQLIQSLFYNLLSNAIKYNVKNGTIKVFLKNNFFEITNTGSNLPLPKEKIFQRFYKQSSQIESYGLGLAIVKKTCEALGLEINYHFNEPNLHSFSIIF